MGQNFLPCDRDQELLLPPSLGEWLAEDHLAWFVLDAVGELDLGAFYSAYRGDGWGGAAHDPQMMVALLVYAYAIGERSSRAIERRCRDDAWFRHSRHHGSRTAEGAVPHGWESKVQVCPTAGTRTFDCRGRPARTHQVPPLPARRAVG